MIKIELMEMLDDVRNEIDMHDAYDEELDPEEDAGEFVGQDDVVNKLRTIPAMINTVFPFLAVTEDLMSGAISPKVFLKRWKQFEKARGVKSAVAEEPEVKEITPDIQDFLKRVSGGNDESGDKN